MLELSGNQRQIWVSVGGHLGNAVREIRVTLPDGKGAPAWVNLDRERGVLVIDRQADSDLLRLRLTFVTKAGEQRARVIEIDLNAGQMREVREVGDHKARTSAKAPVAHASQAGPGVFTDQLIAASRSRFEPSDDLMAVLN